MRQCYTSAKTGPMSDLKARLQEFILEAISNDYENFHGILEQVLNWSVDSGLVPSRSDVIEVLGRAIHDGYAQAFLLSTQAPHVQPVAFSLDRLDELWFRVSPKGKQVVADLEG
jgi:hypothetical protein